MLDDGIISASLAKVTPVVPLERPLAAVLMGDVLRNNASLRALSCLARGVKYLLGAPSELLFDGSSNGTGIGRSLEEN